MTQNKQLCECELSVLRRKLLGWFGLHLVKNAGSRILLPAASVDELSVVEAIPDELLLFITSMVKFLICTLGKVQKIAESISKEAALI